ncbi:helix-turn-helix domain-containing protein [Enterococcus caccae]|uniref:HTH cro/C1-type domain-containing protein n=1 Tax=Enterococcus caccae ATCC BAA-1240 TaxID=1158612 RepID=R3WRV5_9ENTE|nr:helix-turn-helix domain-containing protein [Enterococcus caccae]EOL44550.1 hypothetical protein UC7_02093 [Enterococcus caccae ATCC BAA-1240]EOT58693.1 hypothetical protein I580_02865 [Enterococcus caccae ATCC BAA-1240]
MVEIGNKIKELREAKKVTQKELAEFLNVTPQAVSKWERNQSYPDLDTLIKLSHYFQISTDKILGNTKNTFFSALFSKMEGRKSMINENGIKDEYVPKRTEKSKKILLFGITSMMADYGLYTSLLVTKMNNLARDQKLNVIVQAYSVSKIDEKGKEADSILLCPELSYTQNEIKNKFPTIPVKVIAKKEYGLLDGAKILEDALL